MKDKILLSDVQELLSAISAYMDSRRAALAELDSLIGDGDMGVTIALIFRASVRYAKSIDKDASFKQIFTDLAEVIGENAPSTFGTFISTMLQSIADNCGDVTEIGASEYSQMLKWAAEGVMKRGGAKLGDKTLLDALIPAGEATVNSENLSDAVEAAKKAAESGAENTIEMKAVTGRAGYMGERTIGCKDPGAEAVANILVAVAAFVNG